MDEGRIVHISGLSEGGIAPIVADMLRGSDGNCLIVTSYFDRAKIIAKNLSFFVGRGIFTVPEDDPFFSGFEAKSRDGLYARIEALVALNKAGGNVIVAPASAVLKKMIEPAAFFDRIFTLVTGGEADAAIVRGRLSFMGYERVSFVENKGEFSVRGGILDLFPPDAPYPVRVEFFGDEIESIRFFDAGSQKTVQKTDRCVVCPAAELLPDEAMRRRAASRIARAYDGVAARAEESIRKMLENRRDTLLSFVGALSNRQLLENYVTYFTDTPVNMTDYLPESGLVVVDDPNRIREAVSLREQEAAEDFRVLLSEGRAAPEDFSGFAGTEDIHTLYATRHRLCVFTPCRRRPKDFPPGGTDAGAAVRNIVRTAKQPPVMGGSMEMLVRELRRYIRQGFEITIVCSAAERLSGLRDLLLREDLAGRVHLAEGELAAGIELTGEKKVWLRDADVFHAPVRKRRTKFSEKGKPIRAFTDIAADDLVVHEFHGVGKYAGMEQIAVQGVKRDYLKIKYAGNDVLYVPAEQISVVQKYIGGGESRPKLNKLSGNEWKNAKARAKADIAQMAGELVELSAERKAARGYAFSADTVWQKDFEDKFPYAETEDQLRSIAAIKKDMEQPVPMDRLLCGDVGYGKTEVALRAVFKCVADGKQAAVLVPTTILASQHYNTFKERFDDFPFTVDVLSRFRSADERRALIKKLEKGMIDVIVGTHRLLSTDVAFKDLGLLVIDEEQRFGVRHKERIKALKKNVDVLTLTATPIPRTLHMSLLGLRDMDIIEEPPEDRYPVQTYVMEQSDGIIRETLRRELGRKGQVYVVVSRISAIGRVASEIRALVPEASVAAGHGRMKEAELEDIMLDFIEGKYDILISTTIIESGIDIPNVNTILILDADRFGLSQLHQLRGRVGRSDKPAFAYLLHRKDRMISEVAEKRLRTIREFTEFGAGFRISMRDLEIRGAGNLLGSEQHGHMVTVGYELYCKLVEDAVRALSGAPAADDGIDAQIDLPLSAFLPEAYIDDEVLRLQMYKKIAGIETIADADGIRAELSDRFGPPPTVADHLISVSLMRRLAERAGISRIHMEKTDVVFNYAPGRGFSPESVFAAAGRFGARLAVGGTSTPFLRLAKGGDAAVSAKDAPDADVSMEPSAEEILELLSLIMV
ncbi:MAG: transcription-repair coupling factor [Clostridiales Family XIII bacterium]|jgi:transcription-repair coupling factor (superfamily II helicase)|nr:transcription-repair coupling factor [Clostridiales Family XIII bacterium]